MSSFSGGDSRSGKSPAPNKVKSILPSIRAPDPSYTPVILKKKCKSKANSLSPKSPEFQQILNNTPMLNTSAFDYNNLLSTENSTSHDSIINNRLSSDNFNDRTSHSGSGAISTPITNTTYSTDNQNDIIMSSQSTQQTFTAV
ncbi:uncharacterized protein LOC112683523 [Sipha flava]|jgi:hypothetical protein|uniref:Uncharacterized protein LOC112683523 n=1 Tax=Sipha flava TaxID=143950 RepID=A0A2S2QEB2_9HEMI|nr:uncharacterized protein LOC112683523 [Sipha flava]